MPNYDYKCLDCGHQFKALMPPGTETTKCLDCGYEEAQKQLSAPNVQFLGSGFYKTDSRTESKGDNLKKPSVDKPKTESKKVD